MLFGAGVPGGGFRGGLIGEGYGYGSAGPLGVDGGPVVAGIGGEEECAGRVDGEGSVGGGGGGGGGKVAGEWGCGGLLCFAKLRLGGQEGEAGGVGGFQSGRVRDGDRFGGGAGEAVDGAAIWRGRDRLFWRSGWGRWNCLSLLHLLGVLGHLGLRVLQWAVGGGALCEGVALRDARGHARSGGAAQVGRCGGGDAGDNGWIAFERAPGRGEGAVDLLTVAACCGSGEES